MPGSIAFPQASYANGTHVVGPKSITDGATRFQFQIQRCTDATPTIWPNASTTLNIEVDQSNDGGVTWSPISIFSAQGGISPGRNGDQATFSGGDDPLLPGTSRLLQMTAIIAGGPLFSSATFGVT